MCQARSDDNPASLHEKVCRTTHGAPCKAAHAIGSLFKLILGRSTKPDCCSSEADKAACHCKPPSP